MIRKSFVIESRPENLKLLRDKVRDFLEGTKLADKDRQEMLVAVGEGCTNAIRHAYDGEPGHPIRVTVQDQRSKVVVRIRDYGRKIDLGSVKLPELPPRRPGGLGIYFMTTMMDQLEYNTRWAKGNELILVKCKGPAPKGGPHEVRREEK